MVQTEKAVERNIKSVTNNRTGNVTYRVQINHEDKTFRQNFPTLEMARLARGRVMWRWLMQESNWDERIPDEILEKLGK